ncbi:MAG: hypothetical protein HGGPFJEG_01521 [Ignavibacteria bacterium]|nr:hypothetical protein [Ignavibacteria bacterium]
MDYLRLKDKSGFYFDSIVNSYSQIFFSNNKGFAFIIILSSFIDLPTGISGLFCLLMTIFFANWLGFSPDNIRNGLYGFNSLLVGFGLGIYYKISWAYLIILVLLSFLTLIFTVVLSAIFDKYKVPFLSLPFIFSTWIAILSLRTYPSIEINERGVFLFNDLINIGGYSLLMMYNELINLSIPFIITVYFKSMGSILFQYNIVSGIIITAGVLYHSRIAFTLSLLGFFAGFIFYYIQGAGFSDLYYSYIGFNFILTSIALGGFFLIPSKKSYLLVLIVIPITAVLMSALGYVYNMIQLPLYSLPFNIIVILTILALNYRLFPNKLDFVYNQQYSPENNLYKFKNRIERYKNDTYYHISLPFFGYWKISQGHNGNITHRQDWRYAWDFIVTDEFEKPYKSNGAKTEDFFCYNLPVISPAAGYVVDVLDDVDDNEIGKINLKENWGNTIIIKHGEYVYSKISHLKKNSITVKTGSYVKRGDMIGACGNSGRSPEPHIHFQIQNTPYIDSKTIIYPISYYIVKKENVYSFHSFDYPLEGETISRVVSTSILKEAFDFYPGREFKFKSVRENGREELHEWIVYVDIYNYTYLFCKKTRSYAYFVNNDTLHYFTDFVGDRNSLLYYFYLAANKVLLGYYKDLEIKDMLPVSGINKGLLKLIQDFAAPFKIFLNSEFGFKFQPMENEANPSEIRFSSYANSKLGNIVKRKLDFVITLNNNSIQNFSITENNKKITAECVN